MLKTPRKKQARKSAFNYVYTRKEQIANTLTHGVCVPGSIYAFLTLYVNSHNTVESIAAILYGSSAIACFLASSVFHLHCYMNKEKKSPFNTLLQLFDRITIYYFISSSYAPWLLLKHYPQYVWFTSIWYIYILAAFGILFEVICGGLNYPLVSLTFYILMGVFPYLFLVIQGVQFVGSVKILMTILTYLAGTYFFNSDGKIPYAHAIWHVILTIASLIHYSNVYTNFYS